MNTIFNYDKESFDLSEGINYLAFNLITSLLERATKEMNKYTKQSDMVTLLELELQTLKDKYKTFGNIPEEQLSEAHIEIGEQPNTFVMYITNRAGNSTTVIIEL